MTSIRISRRTWLIPAGCLAFILFFTVFGERGLLRIYEMKQEKHRIEHTASELQLENQKMRLAIEALRNDRHQVERIARKELGLVHTNEIIYKFPANESK